MNLTPEQERAVTERGRDVIVTAGAGSGKTRVLVERYVGLLQDHTIDELVAVTFTEAAAAEMRGRVRQVVTERPDLSQHVNSLDTAIIGTIHSLCLQLLRENPVEAGIDPGAGILDENLAQREVLAACRDAIEAAASKNGPGIDALLILGIGEAQRALPGMVERRDEVRRAFEAMGEHPDQWELNIRKRLDAFVAALITECRDTLERRRLQLTLARNADEPAPDKLDPYVKSALETLGQPLKGDTDDFLARLEEAAKLESPGGKGAKNAWRHPVTEVRGWLREIRSAYGGIAPFLWNPADADALPALASLRLLFEGAVGRYEERKRELAALDFLDLELKAIEMLRNAKGVAAAYRKRFRHVLVDEAQDLNPTQDELLSLLTRGAENDPRPERFFVGDAKQSIYRFRRSDVRILNKLTREAEEADGATISLNTSFRSHQILVTMINGLMTGVLGDANGDTPKDYEARMEPMKSGRASPDSTPPIEVLQIARRHITPDEEGSPTQRELRQMEAFNVAGRIRSIIEDERLVWDKESGTHHPAQPGDIVILLRGMLHVDEYERALESQAIPYRTATTGNFYTRPEVIDLTNLLEWLSEPANDIALVGLLRSPFFAIDDESLIALKQTGRPWMDALREPPPGVLPRTRPFCEHAARVLDQLRQESRLAGPEQLLERALTLTNYEASWAPLRGGEQALANIRQFVGMAREMGGTSVDEFVDYIRLLRDDLSIRGPQAALDAGNAVRLLTIHSSKGLEFPIVVLADAGAAHGASRASSVLWRADEGISMTLEQDIDSIGDPRPKPGFHSYLKERENQEDGAERKRLLYVAATRAADLLIVSGVEPSGETQSWLSELLAYGVGLDFQIDPPRGVDKRSMQEVSPGQDFVPPAPDTEEPAIAPLLGHQGAIPIRASTPATALERHDDAATFFGRPDPVALIRGTVAHAAIEEWFTRKNRPDVRDIARRLSPELSDDALTTISGEVDAMLNDFDTSDLAASLRHPAARAYFEMPFSWDWDGVAVHGSIDLAYQNEGQWYVVDFKTDRVEKGREAERAAAYLTQLGVYAGAIEAATQQRPKTGLMFLRTGTLHWVSESDIELALAATRRRIDDGELSLDEIDGAAEFVDEPLSGA